MVRSSTIICKTLVLIFVIAAFMKGNLAQDAPEGPAQADVFETDESDDSAGNNVVLQSEDSDADNASEPSDSSESNNDASLDRQLFLATFRLHYREKPPSTILPELRRLIALGATTSSFHEHINHGLGDVLSNRFFRQDLERNPPDESLFECLQILIPAMPPWSSYCYGMPYCRMMDKFLVTWRHPIHDDAVVASRDHAQRFFDQCIELQRLVGSNRYPLHSDCRACCLLTSVRSSPLPDFVAEKIVEFLRMDLVEHQFGVNDDLTNCMLSHSTLGAGLGHLHQLVLMGIAADPALLGVLLPVVLSTPESLKHFLNVMHGSKPSRKRLIQFLTSKGVGSVLHNHGSGFDALICELVRRRDRVTLNALLVEHGRSPDPSQVPAQFAALRFVNNENIGQLLRKAGYKLRHI